jgi:hypothetical protein
MRTSLDTPKSRFYIPLPVWAGLVALLLAGQAFASNKKGVQLPDGAAQVGEDRYRAPDDYDGTLKYYRLVYPPSKYRWKAVIDQPGVKAMHIAVRSRKGGVEGINIYEANDEVRIYLVPAEPAKARKAARKKK